MKQTMMTLCAGTLMLSACADSGANYTPILDGDATPAFQSDLTGCQMLARYQHQIDKETKTAAALGASTGALFGAMDNDGTAAGGALVGALSGGVAGAVNARDKRKAIVVECLRGRGHPVVG
jgi:hypothetical protein